MSDTPTSALYQGIAGSPEQQDDARRRVHWACGEVRGQRVLHVGCGVGIAAILLGREGKTVLGVDRDADAIAAARDRLRQEEEPVQLRVRFQVGEAHALDLAPEAFDTVLIGDLLRRLAEPRRALAQLDGLLGPGARLVITTGYGEEIERLALGDLLDLLSPSYRVEMLEPIGDAVGVTAIRDGAGANGEPVLRAALSAVEARLAEAVERAAAERSQHAAPERDQWAAERLPSERDTRLARAAEEAEALHEARRAAERALLAERKRLVLLEVQRDGALTERDRVREALAAARSDLEAAREDARSAIAEAEERARAAENGLADEREASTYLRERRAELARRLAERSRDAADARVQAHRGAAEVAELRHTRDSEVHELKVALRRRSAVVSRLEQTVARLEPQAQNLAEIRAGHAYRLMRVLWRANAAVRHPFKRSGRRERVEAADQAAESRGLPAPSPTAASGASSAPASRSAPSAPEAPTPRRPTTRQRYDALDVEADRRRFLAGAIEPAERRAPGSIADLRIAAIAGVDLEAGLAPVCELLTPRPDNWRYALEARLPHLLLVESTTGGNQGSWSYRIAETIHPDAGGLAELVAFCRELGVPTAFWFTRPAAEASPFVRAMRRFDHVLVADPAALDTVAAAVGEQARVSGLPFAAAPAAVPHAGDRQGVVWIGEWPARWPARSRALLAATLDAALPHGLTILDEGISGVPERFQPALPCGSRADRLRALASARVAVVAAAPGSGTMPPLAYDALAAGASVLLLGASALVPRGLEPAVLAATESEEAEAGLASLLGDEEGRAGRAARVQHVLASEHTHRHRLESLAETAGLTIGADA